MASTSTYGSFPGVRVQEAGGAVTGVVIGREEYLVIFGNGDSGTGNASVNDPTTINSKQDADTQFGADTELADAMRDAVANGANLDYLYGVMTDEKTVTAEDITSGGDAADSSAGSVISNVPIVEDTSLITVEDDSATTIDVEFRYTDVASMSTPGSADTMFINPHTGEWKADAADNYNIDYSYDDWSTAFDAADNVVSENETGVYVALDEAESVASTLSTKVQNLRANYQLVVGLAGIEPNSDSSESPPDARIDTSSYSHSLDNDALFVAGPARAEDTDFTVLGGVGGHFAGNDIDDPVYNDKYNTDGPYSALEQALSSTDATNLRDGQAIPLIDQADIRIGGNVSTSQETDWDRTWHTRKVVDQVILIAKELGATHLEGAINNEDARESVEELIGVELRGLVGDDLLLGNTEDTTNWSVDVYKVDSDTVGIDLSITPTRVAKEVDVSLTINTS